MVDVFWLVLIAAPLIQYSSTHFRIIDSIEILAFGISEYKPRLLVLNAK